MAVDIIPAVLPKSFKELEALLLRLRAVSPWLQIDVTADIFGGIEALPLWEEYDFEFDLFIEPAPFAVRALELGASRVIVHERFASARQALEDLQDARTGDYPVEVGLGLRATDLPQIIEQYAGLFDYVQVMGIRHEGSQGNPPAPEAIELVRALRVAHPELVIQVDGAAGSRARAFAQAGADRLVVGSPITQAEDPRGAYKQLYTEANGSQ